ncbi:MarR family winged helix-turn-helix transcriptional regulator [Cryobacterium sp. PAMC25264]|uniref:MarR family winged helix-turn-helix transcriptional regulator n=1 Tax=Cryobacterium sp. PAMC25264 TaxID=2861288 RepID=UPI001C625DCE|nr:MarR family winged helix-turn-helix transcriptional regulator [Cryobacterium sp. PAMC25264]QYF73783.1 MarR family winged helix-turn-helix transcriptional regulator [Cryobacterium sp. PAMC25264]
MTIEPEFPSAQDAANDSRILVFGRLLGAANRLEYILGRSLEEEAGLSHSLFELLLVVGRAGPGGIAARDIAQARVLTSGGATRLVNRAAERGLITRRVSDDDGRVQLIELTPHGEEVLLAASTLHAHNVQRYLLDVLPADQAEAFAQTIRTLSKAAAQALPLMP